MRSKKSKKMNGGNIIKKLFGGMGEAETASFTLIQMILLGVLTVFAIYNTFFNKPKCT